MNQDGNKGTQDPVLPGQASTLPGSPSGTGTPKTYSQEELDRVIATRHSTLDKRIADLTSQTEATRGENERLRKESDDRVTREREERRKAAGNDPDLIRLLNREDELAKKEKELLEKERKVSEKEKEHDELFKSANDIARDKIVADIAKEAGVSVESLKEFPGNTTDEIRANAQRLAKVVTAPRLPAPVFGTPGTSGGKTALEYAAERIAEAKTRPKSM